jgi:hypothetical protein
LRTRCIATVPIELCVRVGRHREQTDIVRPAGPVLPVLPVLPFSFDSTDGLICLVDVMMYGSRRMRRRSWQRRAPASLRRRHTSDAGVASAASRHSSCPSLQPPVVGIGPSVILHHPSTTRGKLESGPGGPLSSLAAAGRDPSLDGRRGRNVVKSHSVRTDS